MLGLTMSHIIVILDLTVNIVIGVNRYLISHFSISNPCRGAFSRTTLSMSATNPCRGAISRTRLSIPVCEGEL